MLNTTDYVIIGLYFVAVFVIAFFSGSKKGENGEAADYFLGGRNLGWFVIGASLFASNIGSEHLVGLAGQGASGDLVAGQFELLASLILILLGWVFVPFYLKSGVFTMPEFLEKRYNGWARTYLSYVSIVAYVLTKISVTIFAGAIVFTALLGISFWTGAIVIVVATGIYTVFGGFKAVVYTDMMQMFVLVGGSIILTVFGLNELGGVGELMENTTANHWSLWRPVSDTSYPWTGIMFGAPILGIWYWCTDQFIVQRVLAAKDIDTARKGALFGGYMKLLPLFIFMMPGVVAYAIAQKNPELLSFADGGYDAALPLMVKTVLPAGLRGLVVAGLLAALMSSLSSVFNSCSTLITFDVYKKYRPQANDKELVRAGRISTVVLVALGIAWIPMMQMIEGGLFQKLQSIQAYISPPIAAAFLLGIFFKKINSAGAKWALLTGAVLGVARLSMEIAGGEYAGFLHWYVGMNFLHFALLLFAICSAVLVLVSLAKPEAESYDDETLVWNKANAVPMSSSTRLLTFLLILCVVTLWVVF
jgi:SSS family solute:Na+ symporter